ncbi:hypothetical protein ACFR9U_09690 [Halorientalis brevis]|uniref:Uncharacterized protein n=1 Tax=Halorientalis brevis TaxID=1126241 RepID=A0ABD6CB57_9EURY|nr:hypothetical protein [Halorientalis brevis]
MQWVVSRYVDDPTNAADVRRLFCRVAAVFSGVWFATVYLGTAIFDPVQREALATGEWTSLELAGLVVGAVAMSLFCVLNAGYVGGWLWNRLAEHSGSNLTAGGGTVVGGTIGLVTYLTGTMPIAAFLAARFVMGAPGLPSVLSGEPSKAIITLLTAGGLWLYFTLFGAAVMAVVTLGIPFFLSVAVGRALGATAEQNRTPCDSARSVTVRVPLDRKTGTPITRSPQKYSLATRRSVVPFPRGISSKKLPVESRS